MLRNYYSDLGLEKNAGAEEIKKAYRKLAMIFHPDKNDTPLARQRFNQINEAYQVLSDAEKKKGYDLAYQAQFMFFSATAYDVKPTANQNVYRRVKVKVRASKKNVYSKSAILWAKWINRISFFFAILLFVDALLPSREIKLENFKIKHDELIHIIAADVDFPLDNQEFISSMRWSENFVVCQTPILGTNLKMKASVNPEIQLRMAAWVTVDNFNIEARPAYGIYTAFMFAPIMLLIFSFVGGFKEKKSGQIVDFSIIAVIMDLYTLYFLFV